MSTAAESQSAWNIGLIYTVSFAGPGGGTIVVPPGAINVQK